MEKLEGRNIMQLSLRWHYAVLHRIYHFQLQFIWWIAPWSWKHEIDLNWRVKLQLLSLKFSDKRWCSNSLWVTKSEVWFIKSVNLVTQLTKPVTVLLYLWPFYETAICEVAICKDWLLHEIVKKLFYTPKTSV